MPRTPRLDAPGVLHHVMGRGIERSRIFIDDTDREAFLARLARVVESTGIEILAWALMPNHFHLLVRTWLVPLERAMRSLLTGYAVAFNRRHDRVGHLFQNRFKSIVCDQDAYFLELVRYIHLNPVRAGIVASVAELEQYPFSGHSTLVGTLQRPWQSRESVLAEFGSDLPSAVEAYRQFVVEGAAQGRRPDLSGGGLVRSAGGWEAVKELRRGRENFKGDERVLGGPDFVTKLLEDVATNGGEDSPSLDEVVEAVCLGVGVDRDDVLSGSRERRLMPARSGISYLWLERLGGHSRDLMELFGASRVAIRRHANRGRLRARVWEKLLEPRLRIS